MTRRRSPTTRCARKTRTDVPIPTPPFWGVREVEVDLDEVYPYLDRHVLFTLHWGGRGQGREAKAKLIEEEFQPRLERMWREQDYLRPRALIGYFPCNADGNELIMLGPRGARASASSSGSSSRASPSTTGSAWPITTGPLDSGRGRRVRDPGRDGRVRR